MKKRASYFFVLDVFIGCMILVLTLIIIFSSRVNSPMPEVSYRMAEDFMTFISTTEYRDTGSIYKLDLTKSNKTKDTSQSLLQVLAELNINGYLNETGPGGVLWSTILAKEMVNGVVPPQYGINLSINGTQIYGPGQNLYVAAGTRPREDLAHVVLSARRVSYIKVRDENGDLVPLRFYAEVKMWT